MKNWDPDFYDKNCIMQFRTALEMINKLNLSGTEKILDVGSGSGKITCHLSSLTRADVVGIDVSTKMVQFAREHYRSPNLTFLEKDILDIDYVNCFDLVVSFWTLSWVQNQHLAFENIINALKPGGEFFLMYPMRHNAYDVADELIKQPKWQIYFRDFLSPRPFITESRYRSLVQFIPDIECSITPEKVLCNFSSDKEMKESIQSWMSYLDCLKEHQLKQEFLDEFVAAYKAYTGLSTPSMQFSVLEISGKKKELICYPDALSKFKAKL